MEDPSGSLQGKVSSSSTTMSAKANHEGVAIAQPPLEGDSQSALANHLFGAKQGEVVGQFAREDVMEAPGMKNQLDSRVQNLLLMDFQGYQISIM